VRTPLLPEEWAEKIKEILRTREEVAALYLFGSRARGEAQAGSDLDLALVFHPLTPDEAFFRRGEILADLEENLRPLKVHLLDLERVPPALAYEILKEGLLLWERDRDRRVEVEARRLAEALDFLPRRRMHIQVLQSNP
jgi:predicted nucleotidyltransferase